MLSSGPYSDTMTYRMSQDWEWAPPEWPKVADCDFARDHPQARSCPFCSCFQLGKRLSLTSEAGFHFSSLPRVLQISTNLSGRLQGTACQSWHPGTVQGLKSSKTPLCHKTLPLEGHQWLRNVKVGGGLGLLILHVVGGWKEGNKRKN